MKAHSENAGAGEGCLFDLFAAVAHVSACAKKIGLDSVGVDFKHGPKHDVTSKIVLNGNVHDMSVGKYSGAVVAMPLNFLLHCSG